MYNHIPRRGQHINYSIKSRGVISNFYCRLTLSLIIAPHNSAQNEAEQTNAAIGKALTTGKPVEPPTDPFHGLTQKETNKMSLKEIEQRCQSWKVANTWNMTSEISERIKDEPELEGASTLCLFKVIQSTSKFCFFGQYVR